MNKKHKKIALKIFTFLNILFLSLPSACFGDVFDISGSSMSWGIDHAISTIEDRYEIDSSQMSGLMQNLNVAQRKASVPQVSITFNPANPTPGQKVTANAQPTYFSNPSEKLYFTWLLAHKGEAISDADEDDLETYKKRAAQITANAGFDWEDEPYSDDSDNDGYKAIEGGDDQKGKPHYCFTYDSNSGKFYPDDETSASSGFGCGEHLFPEDIADGNGNFGTSEEKKWHTNPNDPDTGDYGQPDEATIAGLGIKSFSWTYQEGDQVGVAVEGTSMLPTKISDASYKIMWAISGKGCDDDDDIESVDDINDQCLPRSFVDPAQKGENEKIDLQLEYAPEFPTNNPSDTTGENSDILSVSSIMSGTNKNKTFFYDWKIYKGNTMDEQSDDWKIITKNELTGLTQASGVGINSIKFGLNFKDSPKYLKVRLLVSESASSDSKNTSRGQAVLIIPLASNSEKLNIYSAKVSEDTSLSKEDLRCSNPNKICQVAKNEIMAVEAASSFDNFFWTVNGEPLTYNYINNFTEPSNLVYFPVLQSVGKEFILSMTANKKTTGEKVVLTKNFKVVDPDIMIYSSDETTCAPTILGYFLNPDGTETPDESQKNFEALQGSTVKLEALFLGPTNNLASLQWSVPEAGITSMGKTISFDALNPTGNTYTVSALITYVQDTATKKALYDYWNVPFGQFYEKEITKQINIDVVDSLNAEEGELVQNGKKPVASLFSGISAYFIFLFKLMLTTALIIFGLGILSSLASGRREVD